MLVEDYRTILDLTHRFVEAAQQAGLPLHRTSTARQQEGVGYSQMTRNGRFRGSTARTFLAQAKGRPNLRVETDALATRLLFDGKRCVGVAFRQGGQDRRAERRARGDPVAAARSTRRICCRFRASGPAAHLQSIGVPVVHDLPGVGANLSDHYVVRVSHRVQGRGIDQRAVARRAAGARDRSLVDDRARRADLRRHHRAGVLPQPRGAGEPRPAAAVHARRAMTRACSASWSASPA